MRTKRNNIPKTSDKIDIQVLKEHCQSLDLNKNNDLNFWLYCNIAMTTGLRSVDILEMKVSDINFIKSEVHLKEKKTGKRVKAPLGQIILDKIDRSREFVIWNEKYKGNVSLMTINRRLKKIYEGSGSNVSSHSIRKSVATIIYNKSGNDIIKAMIFLNHSSPVVTKNYLNITQEEKFELYSLLL
jgi:integrase